MNQPKWNRAFMAIALATAGVIAGANLSPTNSARGEVTATPEPPTFQAGSVPVLREISATLRQMDARLARLEVTAQKMQAAAARSAVAQPPDPSGITN